MPDIPAFTQAAHDAGAKIYVDGVHYTAHEYLVRTQAEWNPDAQLNLACTCITYLSFDVFRNGSCTSDDEFEQRLHENKLFDYAVRYWGEHVSMAESGIHGPACRFLSDIKLVPSATQGLLIPGYKYPRYSQRGSQETTGLHLAARFGLARTSQVMLSRQTGDISIALARRDGHGLTPLHVAVEYGHTEMIRLLLELGSDYVLRYPFKNLLLPW